MKPYVANMNYSYMTFTISINPYGDESTSLQEQCLDIAGRCALSCADRCVLVLHEGSTASARQVEEAPLRVPPVLGKGVENTGKS